MEKSTINNIEITSSVNDKVINTSYEKLKELAEIGAVNKFIYLDRDDLIIALKTVKGGINKNHRNVNIDYYNGVLKFTTNNNINSIIYNHKFNLDVIELMNDIDFNVTVDYASLDKIVNSTSESVIGLKSTPDTCIVELASGVYNLKRFNEIYDNSEYKEICQVNKKEFLNKLKVVALAVNKKSLAFSGVHFKLSQDEAILTLEATDNNRIHHVNINMLSNGLIKADTDILIDIQTVKQFIKILNDSGNDEDNLLCSIGITDDNKIVLKDDNVTCYGHVLPFKLDLQTILNQKLKNPNLFTMNFNKFVESLIMIKAVDDKIKIYKDDEKTYISGTSALSSTKIMIDASLKFEKIMISNDISRFELILNIDYILDACKLLTKYLTESEEEINILFNDKIARIEVDGAVVLIAVIGGLI